jgi:Zn-dependent peptidase ImmA (M78 family)/transcriptional regulator with XRE-family HTH domain
MDNIATLFSRLGPRVIPERVTEAREALSFSMADLGRAIDVTRQAISQYETGAKHPEGEVLSKLGKALNQPIAYFTTDRPSGHGRPGTVFFRSFASKTKATNKKCEIYRDWLDQITFYLGGMVTLPRVSLPADGPVDPSGTYSMEEIERFASQCRRMWGLGDGPISNLILLLESKGSVTVRTDFADAALDAFSCWIGARPFIFLSSDRSAVRSRYDAAHELGHLILHSGVTTEQMEDEQTHRRVEKEANRFAAAFLLPRQVFRYEVHSKRLNSFLALKRRWRVSVAALIARCKDLRIIDDYEFIRLRKLMSHYGYIKQEPLDDQIEPEEPTVLRRSIELLTSTKTKDAAEILTDLRLSPQAICALSGAKPELFAFADQQTLSLKIR